MRDVCLLIIAIMRMLKRVFFGFEFKYCCDNVQCRKGQSFAKRVFTCANSGATEARTLKVDPGKRNDLTVTRVKRQAEHVNGPPGMNFCKKEPNTSTSNQTSK